MFAGQRVESGGSVFVVRDLLTTYNATNGFVPTDAGYKTTVATSTLTSLTTTATQQVWAMASFANSQTAFMTNVTSAPLNVFANGYNSASTGTYTGFGGMAAAWVTNGTGATVPAEWTSAEAVQMLLSAADSFKFTTQFLNQTRLLPPHNNATSWEEYDRVDIGVVLVQIVALALVQGNCIERGG